MVRIREFGVHLLEMRAFVDHLVLVGRKPRARCADTSGGVSVVLR
jgi:hypothetical protein